MTTSLPLPKLITFDGEARSGKGTIVQLVKDHIRDELGMKVMLIDAGQVFRCLVVAATNRGVDVNDPDAIDTFLGDDTSAEECVQFVKAVYHMQKIDRDAILYTNEVSVGSAKIGARPLSQAFKDELLKKWLRDAGSERYDVVLLDGRALEEVGVRLEAQGLCNFVMGLYFVCDPIVGARRTLGYADMPYHSLDSERQATVDELVKQIVSRNEADRTRSVQPIVPPASAPRYILPDIPHATLTDERFMATIDTSAEMKKDEMASPVITLVSRLLTR
ncbi:MAG: (d)CMP kinase [Candidatus Saccharimonadales bacterium]